MKTFQEYLTEEQEIFEALDPSHKEIVMSVKDYFKKTYGFPGTRFKTVPNKVPHLTVVTNGDKHTFNAADLNKMLTIRYGKGSDKKTFLRADYIEGDINQWKEFLKDVGKAENI